MAYKKALISMAFKMALLPWLLRWLDFHGLYKMA